MKQQNAILSTPEIAAIMFLAGFIAGILLVAFHPAASTQSGENKSPFSLAWTLNCPEGTRIRESPLVLDTNAFAREHNVACWTIETAGEIVYNTFNGTSGQVIKTEHRPGYVCGYCQ